MLKLQFIIRFICVALLCNSCYPKNKNRVILVFDNVNSGTEKACSQPRNYRNAMLLNSLPIPISGSAQPNLQDFKYIIKEAKKYVPQKNIFIVDLRKEPHALLNQKAVSWYGFRNQVTNDLETKLINNLRKLKSTKVYQGINKLEEGYFIPTTYIQEPIKTITTEKKAITTLQAEYTRLLVVDHYAPEAQQVDLFLEFIKTLPPEHWVHFHCRGGKGRTSTFMVLYDIIQNASQLSLDSILNRQLNLGGSKLSKYTFTATRKQWKSSAAQNRYIFIKQFYNYVLDNQGYQKTRWSKWIQQTK